MARRFFATALALILVLSLAACGGKTNDPPTEATPPATQDTGNDTQDTSGAAPDYSGTSLTFASDAVGSSSYNIIVEMSKVLEEKGGFGNIDVSPTSPGGMGAPYLFAEGTGVDIAFVNAAPAKWAREAGTLGRPPVSGCSPIAGGIQSSGCINCIRNEFLEKNNVSTIEEVFEKKLPLRIGCSAVGSMDAECVVLLLEYFGVTEEDLNSWGGSVTHGGGSEIQDLMSDGQIDFYLDHTSQNSSTMAEIAMTQDVTFPQWGDDLINWFIQEKGFQTCYIPAGSFRGQDDEIRMPGSPDRIFVRSDMDEDIVYTITKVLCENRDSLAAVYSSLEPWEVEKSCESERIGGNALHPGAEKYYREMGYLT